MARLNNQPIIDEDSPSSALTRLLDFARKKSYVTNDDILHFLPEAEQDIDQLEGVYNALGNAGIAITDDELARFGPHCTAPGCADGIETRHRSTPSVELWAMHVDGVGTLTARRWASGASASFTPGRDPALRESYRDTQPTHALAVEYWREAYCADKLAMAGEGVASVPTFTYGGQEWINDGGWYGPGKLAGCEGWRFVPLADWHGPTYSYSTQCRAWDEGCLERGDRRGLVVSVRGQKCVLAGAVRFFG